MPDIDRLKNKVSLNWLLSTMLSIIGFLLLILISIFVIVEIILDIPVKIDYHPSPVLVALVIQIITLVVVLLLVWHTISFSKKTLEAPYLIEGTKKHTEALLKIAKDWEKSVVEHTPANVMRKEEPKEVSFEKNRLLQHLIDFHLPDILRNLPDKCNEFNSLNYRYEILCFELIKKISKDVDNRIGNESWVGQIERARKFIEIAYQGLISNIRDGSFNYDKNNLEFECGGDILRIKEIIITKEIINNEITYHQEKYSHPIASCADPSDKEKMKTIFIDSVFGIEYFEKNKDRITQIIRLEKKLDELYKEIKEDFEYLSWFPLLPDNGCPILNKIVKI